MMQSRWAKYSFHVLGWILLYILPYLISFEGVTTMFAHHGDYIHLLSFVLLLLFSYANYYLFIPRFYLRRSYIIYVLLLAACFWLVISLPMKVMGPPGKPPGMQHAPSNGMQHEMPHDGMRPERREPMPFLFGRNYNMLLFFVSIFVGINLHSRRLLHQIEKEKLNAELLFLKAQINPHFLFNTLNSIYALAINKDDRTPGAIVQLSELMRYIMKEANDDVVALDKEIQYIDNYVALQRSRLGDTVNLDYQQHGNAVGKKIAPLILITFIENAFKHGVNPDKNSVIEIDLNIMNDEVKLYVFNNKVNVKNEEQGIGMKNSKERLEALYPSKHALIIDDATETYKVELSITLS
jgi:hypothetical protein